MIRCFEKERSTRAPKDVAVSSLAPSFSVVLGVCHQYVKERHLEWHHSVYLKPNSFVFQLDPISYSTTDLPYQLRWL
jgi:hypothetical protein